MYADSAARLFRTCAAALLYLGSGCSTIAARAHDPGDPIEFVNEVDETEYSVDVMTIKAPTRSYTHQEFAAPPGSAMLICVAPRENRWYGVDAVQGRVSVGGVAHVASRFSLSLGRRWMVATTGSSLRDDVIYRDDVVVGDLREPNFYVRVDASATFVDQPAVAPAPGGGWLVAWIRNLHDIATARVTPGGDLRSVRPLEVGVDPLTLTLMAVRGGFALAYTSGAPRDQVDLVLLLLDDEGAVRTRSTITTAAVNAPILAYRPRAGEIAVAFTHSLDLVGFATVRRTGSMRVRPRTVWQILPPEDSSGGNGFAIADFRYVAGRYWIGTSSSACASEVCSGSSVAVIPVRRNGTPGRPIFLDDGAPFLGAPTLGHSSRHLLVAWKASGSEFIHIATITRGRSR